VAVVLHQVDGDIFGGGWRPNSSNSGKTFVAATPGSRCGEADLNPGVRASSRSVLRVAHPSLRRLVGALLRRADTCRRRGLARSVALVFSVGVGTSTGLAGNAQQCSGDIDRGGRDHRPRPGRSGCRSDPVRSARGIGLIRRWRRRPPTDTGSADAAVTTETLPQLQPSCSVLLRGSWPVTRARSRNMPRVGPECPARPPASSPVVAEGWRVPGGPDPTIR